jgi:hypothetical protein
MLAVFAGAAQGIIKVGDAHIEYFSYSSRKAVSENFTGCSGY